MTEIADWKNYLRPDQQDQAERLTDAGFSITLSQAATVPGEEADTYVLNIDRDDHTQFAVEGSGMTAEEVPELFQEAFSQVADLHPELLDGSPVLAQEEN